MAAVLVVTPAFAAKGKESKIPSTPQVSNVSVDVREPTEGAVPPAEEPAPSVEPVPTTPFVPEVPAKSTPPATTEPALAHPAATTVVPHTSPTGMRISDATTANALSPQRLTNTSSGPYVYAKNTMSPFETARLLLLSLFLGVLGYLFAQGSLLTSFYRWFARVIGVKMPNPSMQSRHV
jgi:hypothetical protein